MFSPPLRASTEDIPASAEIEKESPPGSSTDPTEELASSPAPENGAADSLPAGEDAPSSPAAPGSPGSPPDEEEGEKEDDEKEKEAVQEEGEQQQQDEEEADVAVVEGQVVDDSGEGQQCSRGGLFVLFCVCFGCVCFEEFVDSYTVLSSVFFASCFLSVKGMGREARFVAGRSVGGVRGFTVIYACAQHGSGGGGYRWFLPCLRFMPVWSGFA